MKKLVKSFALFLLFVFHTSFGQCQTNVPQDNIKSSRANYSESQLKELDTSRVPVGQVRHVKQARNGDILIPAGWSGAFRYDGKSFQNFTTKDGLPNYGLRTIMEDRTGKLWFGAQLQDMFVYDGKTFTVLKNKDGKTFKNVWSIIEDKKGNIWLGDVDGLWRFDGISFTHVSQRGAYGIIEDKKGNIWTTGPVNSKVWALSRYDAKSLYHEMPAVTEIKTGVIMDFLGIMEANDGSIWYGGAGGVCRYDGKTITVFKSAADQK